MQRLEETKIADLHKEIDALYSLKISLVKIFDDLIETNKYLEIYNSQYWQLKLEIQYLENAKKVLIEVQAMSKNDEKFKEKISEVEKLIMNAKASDFVIDATKGLLRGPRMINDATRDLQIIVKAFLDKKSSVDCQYNSLGEIIVTINQEFPPKNLTQILKNQPDLNFIFVGMSDEEIAALDTRYIMFLTPKALPEENKEKDKKKEKKKKKDGDDTWVEDISDAIAKPKIRPSECIEYDLTFVDENDKSIRKPKIIYLTKTKNGDGLRYEVVGMDDQLKSNIILWITLPSEFRNKEPAYIIAHKKEFLPILFKITTSDGYTQGVTITEKEGKRFPRPRDYIDLDTKDQFSKLTYAEKLAITLYTSEFYNLMNSLLRDFGQRQKFEKVADFISTSDKQLKLFIANGSLTQKVKESLLCIVFCNQGLLRAEQNQDLNVSVKVTTRGEGGGEGMVALNEMRLNAMNEKGGIVTHVAPTSSSYKHHVSNAFSTRENPTIIIIYSLGHGVNVAPLSCERGEDEVLFAPSLFKYIQLIKEGNITKFIIVPIKSIDQLTPFSYMNITADLRTALICIIDKLTNMVTAFKETSKHQLPKESVNKLITHIQKALNEIDKEGGDVRNYSQLTQNELKTLQDIFIQVTSQLESSKSTTAKNIFVYLQTVQGVVNKLTANVIMTITQNTLCASLSYTNNILIDASERLTTLIEKSHNEFDRQLQKTINQLIKQIYITSYEIARVNNFQEYSQLTEIELYNFKKVFGDVVRYLSGPEQVNSQEAKKLLSCMLLVKGELINLSTQISLAIRTKVADDSTLAVHSLASSSSTASATTSNLTGPLNSSLDSISSNSRAPSSLMTTTDTATTTVSALASPSSTSLLASSITHSLSSSYASTSSIPSSSTGKIKLILTEKVSEKKSEKNADESNEAQKEAITAQDQDQKESKSLSYSKVTMKKSPQANSQNNQSTSSKDQPPAEHGNSFYKKS